MQENKNTDPVYFNENDTINIREELEKYMFHWKWFLLGIGIALLGAFLYLRYTPNQYEAATTILIEDKEKGGLSSELSAFADLGLMGGATTSIDNEMELLKSRTLMERVVKELGINISFYKQGRVITSELYSENVPVKINFFSKDVVFYNLDTTFFIAVKSATKFILKDENGDHRGEYVFGENCVTNFGELTITPVNLNWANEVEEIAVKITPLKKVVEGYRNNIQIQPANKNSNVIKINLTDPVKEKAKDILNNLVVQYNNDAIEDKRMIGKSTNEFINQRLEIVNNELSSVEIGAQEFKTANKLTDIAAEASLVLETNAEVAKKIVDLSTQLKLAEYVSSYVNDNTEALIPANLGLSEASVNASTSKYNELILERNRILKSSSELNPVIINLNAQIAQLRESISQSLKNLKNTLTISLNSVKRQEAKLDSKIALVPKQERAYRDIQRQQQIFETLYLYLLQKREENAITLAVTMPNAKIIDEAYGSDIPVAPKSKIIYLAALLLGGIIPFGVIYILLLLDNKIHNRKDVEAVIKAPVLGDIPNTKTKGAIINFNNDRSSIAESFRLLRTNLSFMLASVKEGTKTIFITSTIAGEGKTYISVNLSSVLAMSGKKVLLIGADIRKPKIGEYLELKFAKGLTDFLMNRSLKVTDVIEPSSEANFDFVSSNILPPNPTELLMNGRFEELLAHGKEHYDYVIVDTAPVNLVTDALLQAHHADLFIYVVRANYLDKRLLEVPKIMYEEKRLPNMAMLINGTDFEKGYGYGYGYAEDEVKKPWYKKLFKI